MMLAVRCHVTVKFNMQLSPHGAQSIHEKQYGCCVLAERFFTEQDKSFCIEHITGADVDQSASFGPNLQNNGKENSC